MAGHLLDPPPDGALDVRESDDRLELHVRLVLDDRVLAREALDAHGTGLGERHGVPSYRAVAETMGMRRADDADLALKRLARLAAAEETGPRVTDRVAVHATFLVEHDRLEAFDEAIHQIGGEQADRARFSYTRAPSSTALARLPARG